MADWGLHGCAVQDLKLGEGSLELGSGLLWQDDPHETGSRLKDPHETGSRLKTGLFEPEIGLVWVGMPQQTASQLKDNALRAVSVL